MLLSSISLQPRSEHGAAVVRAARSYLGVPWVHQGRTRAGLDCAGLVLAVAHDLGLSSFEFVNYGHIPDGRQLMELLLLEAVPVGRPSAGDILLMRFEREPQHLAVVSDYGVVHSYTSVGRVVEHRLDEAWARRALMAFAFPGETSWL